MMKNKKAVFLSLTALLIVGTLMVFSGADTQRGVDQSVEQRLQDFLLDRGQLEEQVLPAVLRAHTRQSLNEIARAKIADPSVVTSHEELVNEVKDCLGAGRRAGSEEETSCAGRVLDQRNFLTSAHQLQDIYADVMRYDTLFIIQDLEIQQVGAWTLLLTAQVTTHLNESVGIARYTRTRTSQTEMGIQGLIDPVASTRRGAEHQIERETAQNWSSESFAAHARAGTYTFDAELNSPSYLERLTGASPAGEFGISSLLPPGTATNTEHSVDYDTSTYEDHCLVEVELAQGSVYISGPYTDFYRRYEAVQEPGQQYSQLECDDGTTLE